ncbi:MAG: FGGY family carbohydrate kinase [Bacteroidota bacterium]
MYFLGYDLGSSSLKACLIEADTGQILASTSAPDTEMTISSPQAGWAEQDPHLWWEHLKTATRKLWQKARIDHSSIKAIGVAYQMHGLVVLDKNQEVLRPSIIWCDSRAIAQGQAAIQALGDTYCYEHLLNRPGNFTAAKLRWVKENEPELYERIFKIMLPGDYLAFRLSGQINTTNTGLSEGIFWDYQRQDLADKLLDYYQIDPHLLPEIVEVFAEQGQLQANAAQELGLAPGTPISYRAGDQPNNAFSLNVLHPGEVATTAGTSGVIYAVSDQAIGDPQSRINTFVHVNHQKAHPRYGLLLCINGTGILNNWLRKHLQSPQGSPLDYAQMNARAAEIAIGSEGLCFLPFGNGAERVLGNRPLGASLHHLDLNRHHTGHLCRAGQEGIVFALRYGFEVFQELGQETKLIRAGWSNMFQSPVFAEAFVNSLGVRLELYNTDGAQGAARGAGLGIGYYANPKEAFQGLTCLQSQEPEPDKVKIFEDAYQAWRKELDHQLNT